MISKLLIFSESIDSNLSMDMLLRTGLETHAISCGEYSEAPI
jgi:hypothetical protein